MRPPRRRSESQLSLPALSGVVAVCLLSYAGAAHAQHPDDYWIFSSMSGGGLLTSQQSTVRQTPVFANLCVAGRCLYTSTNPGFIRTDQNLAGLFVLNSGTTVSLEVVAIDPAVSVKFGNTILDEPGESVVLGTVPAIHIHPSWQLQVPEGETGVYPVEFRFTTNASSYNDSGVFMLALSNGPMGTTTTVPVASTTTVTMPTGGPQCGNGIVEIGEVCDAGPGERGWGDSCSAQCSWTLCGDPDGNERVTATDGLYVLSAAVGAAGCAGCVCDVDGSSASGQTAATDALRVLQHAVGQDVTFGCLPCE